jgi:hypothetical protein
MINIGCDYHPGFQQIAYVNTDTGRTQRSTPGHKEQAEQVYHELSKRGVTVRVGMEASGHARWFERLLIELQFELRIGDAAAGRRHTRSRGASKGRAFRPPKKGSGAAVGVC